MENNDLSKLDQSMALVSEIYPPHWRRLYDNCLAEKFTTIEAMELVKTYIISVGTNGTKC